MSCDHIGDATRSGALERLTRFLPRAGLDYLRHRNFDLGTDNRSNVSLLSPYIRHRLITEQEVLDSVLERHSFEDAGKFIEELFWRGYYKGWLEQHPSVWTDYRSEVDRLVESLAANAELAERYETAVSGNTGIDCFDSWVRELESCGYLHNHSRMWFASIWIFTLRLPWQLGADFFYRNLVDGDPASNTLSWRWVSGLHTKGKTYLARVSNIRNFTNRRFNPAGKIAISAPPVKESRQHALKKLTPVQFERPGVRTGLLVTEEDCSPESLPLKNRPSALMAVIATQSRSPLPVGRTAREFAIGAVSDAVERSVRHFSIPAQSAHTKDWEAACLAWAAANDLRCVVTAYTPVGPVAERLALLQSSLERQGVQLIRDRRAFDSGTWPHATRGFFTLKSQIPNILSRLGIRDVNDRQCHATG